jgi:hypothetical protein
MKTDGYFLGFWSIIIDISVYEVIFLKRTIQKESGKKRGNVDKNTLPEDLCSGIVCHAATCTARTD